MADDNEAVDAGYEEWGEAATFTAKSGTTESCTVVLDFNLQRWGDAVSVGNANAIVNVRRSELAERPRRGSTFTMGDGTVYVVDQPLVQTRYEHQLVATEQ